MSETIGTTLDVRMPQAATLSGELALRIRGGDYHGRVVRIRANQCTIGSAPDCTLRLAGPGLRPLHCIILRGEAGATVRRWSPDTQLNGRAFSDALLMPGDRLEIGPIELEVLDDAEMTQHRRPETGASLPVGELAGEIVSQLRRDLRRDKDARKQKGQRQQLRQSRRRIKSLEAELDRLQAGINSIAAIDELPAPQPQPEAAEGGLQVERETWNSERQSLLGQLQDKEQRAQGLEATLNELRTAIDQEKSRCADATRQAELHQQSEAAATARARELQHQLAALEAANQELQNAGETTAAIESAQRQAHDLFAEAERLREELHQANCSLAAAQCRLSEQEAALAAFREMHQHAVAELDLECKTLQSQLTDAQTKFDEQSGRLAELESQAIAAPDNSLRITELETEMQLQSEQLRDAHAASNELQAAAEKSSAEWSQREQELTQRIECLERLAANLEDELRNAAASPDIIQLAEEQRRHLEQQLSAAQQQWSEQRQALEDQALSAHQQMQDMENQVASLRDALHSTQGQVRERDQLLSQVREEVREQLAIWQQERAQLLEQLQANDAHRNEEPPEVPSHPDVQQACLPFGEFVEHEPSEDRYGDRQMLAGGHALVESNEASGDVQDGDAIPQLGDDGVGNVLARLEAAGIWRQEADAPLSQEEEQAIPAVDDFQPADSAAPEASAEEMPVAQPPQEPTEATADQPDQECPAEAAACPRADLNSEEVQNKEPASLEPQPASSGGQDEDESIEAYMARLLKRVRGDAVANAFVVQQQATEASSAAAAAELVEATPETTQSSAGESAEFLPRKSAPEQAADVAAMRELAVSSTRQAIDRSSQQRFRRNSQGTTLGACALIGLSAGLFGWAFDTGNWIAWGGCCGCLLPGSLLMVRRLQMRASPQGPLVPERAPVTEPAA